jgi:parallel beta-helix repeat protein
MRKHSLIRKYFTIGVIFFFIGTNIVPSIQSEVPSKKTIITVDDEPGDADFTSIKEAVNASSPGDTIEVYSGTYPEDGILVKEDNVSLLGVPYELGEGNDSGQPFIKGNGIATVIKIDASQVVVSNFTIEHPETEDMYTAGIFVNHNPSYEQNNVTISNCVITNSSSTGIYVTYTRDNIRIIGNHVSHCFLSGINIMAYNPVSGFIIAGNVITDCRNCGITFDGHDHQNVSFNRISNCKWGIEFAASNTSVYGNDIENCSLGIRCGGIGNVFTKNNFKNYSKIGFWFQRNLLRPWKNKWIGNYWDTWKGSGPKTILGFVSLDLYGEYFRFIFLFPWVEFDWHPAQEPYDIPEVNLSFAFTGTFSR